MVASAGALLAPRSQRGGTCGSLPGSRLNVFIPVRHLEGLKGSLLEFFIQLTPGIPSLVLSRQRKGLWNAGALDSEAADGGFHP